MWLAKDVPGAAELLASYTRMTKELDWALTGMDTVMNRPVAKAAKMMVAGGKMDGTPLQQSSEWVRRPRRSAFGRYPDRAGGSAAPHRK